ncbi:MAG: hypothetical protein SGJ27_27510 [Candidatus Melainabacteria bacterium]|nr:hypothetical protein [Candidatus Melainabacteria bacterium]
MLELTKIRTLDIAPSAQNRPAYVYAASGLVKIDNRLYTVADDELHLAVFEFPGDKPGNWYRLLPGALALDYKERKKAKPDLESLTLLEPYEYAPHGALLAVPSMSKKKRIKGLLIPLDKDRKPSANPLPIDFTQLREKLAGKIEELNIEGSIVDSKFVRLFHRGSKGKSKSAVIQMNVDQFLKDLHDSHVISAGDDIEFEEYKIGSVDQVPLQFTDAVSLPDKRTLFLATAEDSDNAYDDGASLGSAVGILDEKGRITHIHNIRGRHKLEGVSVAVQNGHLDLLTVSDTDDETKPSALFRTTIESP